MLIWLIIFLTGVSTRPVLLIPITTNTSEFISNNKTLKQLVTTASNDNRSDTKFINTSIFITLRQNDWRDNHHTKMIIWSLESPHHPDFGKNYPRGPSKRMSAGSQIMSFLILGSVIGFILYTYLTHVVTMRKLDREFKTARLREIVHRSAMIMAGTVEENQFNFAERRRSLINMFRGFKL